MTAATRRLVLIRHGRTALNREDRLRGLADPPLDEVGESQAAALVPTMAALEVAVVLCSPLIRAVRTGSMIAAGIGVPVHSDPRFTDRDYGPWTGALRQEVVDRFGRVDAAPGVEPVESVLTRVRPAIDAVLDEHDGTVAVVTHDAVIRPLLAELATDIGPVRAPNGSWNDLHRSADVWEVRGFDLLP